MPFTAKFWGVRGSLPSSPSPTELFQQTEEVLQSFFAAGHSNATDISKYLSAFSVPQVGGYGTATTCVELSHKDSQIIIDGGSGIRNLSEQIMNEKKERKTFHIFMTHFHWDHVIGLPFFTPHFIPGYTIHYYGVQEDLEIMVKGLFKKPSFPVPFESLQAKIHFHLLSPRQAIKVDDFIITPYLLDHPDPCWGYKVQAGTKAYAHCVDTEANRVSREDLDLDAPLYQDVDLMYFDAQYTFPELAEKANWGHSAAEVGLEIAFREKIKKVLFAHHDPGARIKQVQELKRQTLEYYNWRKEQARQQSFSLPSVDWDFAHEGLAVTI